MDVPECQGCRDRDGVIAELRRQIQSLEDRVSQLEARLKQNSSNSSVPPSANPLGAPPPVVKTPTGRKPGGQPGHRGQARMRLPPERVTNRVEYVPKVCKHCQAALPAKAGPNDPEPSWHQVAELPALLAEVTEHRGHARTCKQCGQVTRAAIPTEVRRHGFGPRLTAFVAYLSARCHDGKRTVTEIVENLCGVPLALGTVTNLEQEMSGALAEAHAEALAAVQAAAVKHADETGWKRRGLLHWLWLAATRRVAAYLIQPSRGVAGLTALLGEKMRGFVHSDRWSAYGSVPLRRRQLCWAHLKRDFQHWAEGGGAAEDFGTLGLDLTAWLFAKWRTFQEQGHQRSWLRRQLQPVRQELQKLLAEGRASPDPKLASFCRRLQKVEKALWTFTRVDGMEPTNNHAERQLRPAVLWRKNCFGSWSAAGCTFAARMLTVVQTLRLQSRAVLVYLQDALTAYRRGQRTPSLLKTG